ncbi:peptide ABC transporter substrate-binding protein [Bacillus sp. 1P06AnD]|uniref:peptide ABC transporter substrate-binding protein n=1 Tax=Bacillus sp. 1P06AnD TaxID=3132208 RepID=UPI0039A0D35D
MKKAKGSLLLAIILILATFVSACSGKGEKSAGEKSSANVPQELRVLESVEIPSMDSIMATDATSFTALNNVNEGLYGLDQDNNIVPAVADGDPEVSKDGKQFTVKLKKGLVWANGDPVTAADFVYAWQRAIDPKNASTYGPYMMNGKITGAQEITDAASAKKPYDLNTLGAKAEDDTTLVVNTDAVMTADFFKGLMAFGSFLPQNQKFVEEKGDKYASNANNLLSNGPFKMKAWNGSSSTEWVMVKNDKYRDAKKVHLNKITVNVSKDSQGSVNAFESGEADITNKLSSDIVPQYKDDKRLVNWLDPRLTWLKFNEDNKILANENIRRALATAFNKDDLASEVLNNGSVAANYAVPKDFVKDSDGKDFRAANGDLLTYNAKKAKEYWKKGLQELGMTKVSLGLLGSDTDASKKVDQYLKDQLEKNLEGLTINITNIPFAARIDRETKQQYDIVDTGWAPDYLDPITYSDLFTTDSSNNQMSYSNKEYDALIKQAESTTDSKEKWTALQKAEKILLEDDAALAPVYQQAYNLLVSDKVKGFTHHSVGTEYSYKYIEMTE